MKALDKLRVLLIDDNPVGLTRDIEYLDGVWRLPKLGASGIATREIGEIEDLFEIRWLATSEEAREFRDLSKALSLLDPAALGTEGWVPEIIIFDYALTDVTDTVEERLPVEVAASLSPLTSLRRYAAKRGLVLTPPPTPPISAPQGDDNEGCYCGGLILTLFWAHPCSPLPLTRKKADKTDGTEAGFFEWLLEEDAGGAFEGKQKPGSNWHELLIEAVPGLRHRILQLLQGRTIEVALDDLLALAGSGDHDALEIRSRYAARRLPIAGLFADRPSESRGQEVREWACSALTILFGDLLGGGGDASRTGDLARRLDPALVDFRAGMDHAERLWQAYNSELVGERYHLSELAVLSEKRLLEEAERSELERLCAIFGVDPDQLDARDGCKRNTHDLRSIEGGRSRRWAALMVMVRLELQAAAARQTWREFCRSRGIQESFDPLIHVLRQEDVYLALFPVPSKPIKTPLERGEDPRLNWGFVLRDLSSGGERKNDLGLDVKEVLAGEGWLQGGENGRCKPCGLHDGERYLLRLYARTLEGFDEAGLKQVSWLGERVEKDVQTVGGGDGR